MKAGGDAATEKSRQKGLTRLTRYFWLLLGALIAWGDYKSKVFMREWIADQGGIYELTFYLNFRSVENKGVAFGLLAQYDLANYLLTFTLAFCGAIYVFILFYRSLTVSQAFIASLLFGGGLGNGVDRFQKGQVYDFIDLHLFGWHWPAFNVADMAISLAIIVMVAMMFRKEPRPAAEPVSGDDSELTRRD